MCYSKYVESLLDEVDNRKIDDIEVEEIGIEIRNEQEEGFEDMKGRDKGLEMERIEEKESDNEVTENAEKENELNNEEFTKRKPVNKDNNEEEIVSEMPKLRRLIEDDLERDGNEVNKWEISEDGNNENEM